MAKQANVIAGELPRFNGELDLSATAIPEADFADTDGVILSHSVAETDTRIIAAGAFGVCKTSIPPRPPAETTEPVPGDLPRGIIEDDAVGDAGQGDIATENPIVRPAAASTSAAAIIFGDIGAPHSSSTLVPADEFAASDPASPAPVPMPASDDPSVPGAAATTAVADAVPASAGAVLTDGVVAASAYGKSNPYDATQVQVLAALDAGNLAYTGAGVTVGIMSDSFDNQGGAAQDEQNGALPAASRINVLKDLASGGSDEGRAMMQVVHAIAPGANLAFYTGAVSEQDFADGIIALANAGCKVICDDLSYDDEPFFQIGVVANAIHTVAQQGVSFVTVAHNFGEEAYQSGWSPIASTSFDGVPLTDTQDFGGSNPVQNVSLDANAPTTLMELQWNQPYGQATTDLGVVVFENGAVFGRYSNAGIDGFTQSNFGLGASYPVVGFDLPSNASYQIAIENLSGPDPGMVKDMLFASFSEPDVTLGDANAGTVVGHHMSPDAITVGAVDAGNTPGNGGTPQSEYFSSSGAGTQLWFNFDGSAVPNGPQNLSPVAVSGIDDIATTMTNNGLGDFFGTSAAAPSVAAIVADMLQANPNLTPTQIRNILEQSAAAFGDPNVAGAGLADAGTAVSDAAACYCRGTLILTPEGEVPVEALAVGDRVTTLSEEARPVRWIGWRAYDGRFIAGKRQILPIRIAAAALADGVPARDLHVSPGHALYIDGVLVQAEHLVNGATIVQAEHVDSVEYFHIELDAHDIVFADGAPAESYVDCDNRHMFANGAEYDQLYPSDDRPAWSFCRQRLEWGERLIEIRARLSDRAATLGHALDGDPGLHLITSGIALWPLRVSARHYRFELPAGCADIRLTSRSSVPAETDPGSRDVRRLGVPVERLVLHDADLTVEVRHAHAAFCDGFHDAEEHHRWTDGRGRVPGALLRPFAGGLTLEVYLAPSALAYRRPKAEQAAA